MYFDLSSASMMAPKQVRSTPTKLSRNDLKWNNTNRDKLKDSFKGTKPLPDPITLPQMMVVLLMHLCRKVLLIKTEYKIGLYGVVLLFGSILCDFFPLPKTYMSYKNNILNQYFAKLSLGWTLLLVGLFMWCTCNVYCCGNMARIRTHFCRLVGTVVCWYAMTSFFNAIESFTGLCFGQKDILNLDRLMCQRKGYRWRAFDISGHTFLLMYCNLVINEEAKAIRGWERIKDLLREVDYDEDSPLKSLLPVELDFLKAYFFKFDYYVKMSLGALTGLSILWDFMLMGTILYFHSMVQKVAGGLFAVLTWFITYKVLYPQEWSTGLPGQGLFKYAEYKTSPSGILENRRKSSLVQKIMQNESYNNKIDSTL